MKNPRKMRAKLDTSPANMGSWPTNMKNLPVAKTKISIFGRTDSDYEQSEFDFNCDGTDALKKPLKSQWNTSVVF